MGSWIFAAAVVLVSLIGLFVAGRAHDDTTYWAALAVFIVGVAVVYAMIMRVTGTPRRRHDGRAH